MAPAATPRDLVGRLHAEIAKFVQIAEIRTQFALQGVDLQASPTPEHFTAFLKSETLRAAQIAKDAGIRPE